MNQKSIHAQINKVIQFIVIISVMLTSCDSNDIQENNNIIGEWYSSEIGGRFCFNEDNILNLKVDMSGNMFMDNDNIMHITDSEDDYSDNCKYDGTTYSFEINDVEMFSMSREEESDSAYGEYILESGILYDELASLYGDLNDRYRIIVEKGVFDAEIRICHYDIESENTIVFSGDDLAFFGANEEQETTFNFSVQNDVLTLVSANSSLLVFSKSQ